MHLMSWEFGGRRGRKGGKGGRGGRRKNRVGDK